MAHDEAGKCICVTNHNPNPMELHSHHIIPLSWDGPDIPENKIWLCPTSHVNVHELLRAWRYYLGEPPWDTVRRYFSPYIRELAKKGWEGAYGQTNGN